MLLLRKRNIDKFIYVYVCVENVSLQLMEYEFGR